jgi:uncharacterized protein
MSRVSGIYEGRVAHRRTGPTKHSLSYGVWYLLVDLDELDELASEVRGLAAGGGGVVSFDARDHGPRDGSPLRPWAEAQFRRAGVDLEGGPIRLLSFPRIFGYAFNPITVWFAHGPLGDLRGLIFEVSNTFGEWHHYVLPVTPGEGLRADGTQLVRCRFDKEFFVSPFMTMDASYDITTRVPDGKMALSIAVQAHDGSALTASFVGRRLPLDNRALSKMMVRYPLLTLKVMGGIHLEAIKLWLKGAPYRRRGIPPADVTILDPTTDTEPVSA